MLCHERQLSTMICTQMWAVLTFFVLVRLRIHFFLFVKPRFPILSCHHVCVSNHLSVTSQYCIKRIERIELTFGMEASINLSNTVYKEIRVSPKITVLPSKTLSQTILWKFCHGMSTDATYCQLAWQSQALTVINKRPPLVVWWTMFVQRWWPVYHTNRPPLYTARCTLSSVYMQPLVQAICKLAEQPVV